MSQLVPMVHHPHYKDRYRRDSYVLKALPAIIIIAGEMDEET
jgi:hypothetical protein